MKHFTYVVNTETNEYFFARYHSGYGLGDHWVPISSTLTDSLKQLAELLKRV